MHLLKYFEFFNKYWFAFVRKHKFWDNTSVSHLPAAAQMKRFYHWVSLEVWTAVVWATNLF